MFVIESMNGPTHVTNLVVRKHPGLFGSVSIVVGISSEFSACFCDAGTLCVRGGTATSAHQGAHQPDAGDS